MARRPGPAAVAVARPCSELLPGSIVRRTSGQAYAGARVQLNLSQAKLYLRVYASKAGSDLTLPGWPDGGQDRRERPLDGLLPRT